MRLDAMDMPIEIGLRRNLIDRPASQMAPDIHFAHDSIRYIDPSATVSFNLNYQFI